MHAVLNQTLTSLPKVDVRPKTARWAVRRLFFLNGALFATWASRIPAVQAERDLSNGALGMALLCIALGAVIAIPLAGLLATRIGSDRVCKALDGFALVGAGFATLVPIVFSAAGNTRRIAPGVALASVSSLGYLGFLIGPPLIGFAAELLGLRYALGIIVVMSLLAAMLAPTMGDRVDKHRILKLANN